MFPQKIFSVRLGVGGWGVIGIIETQILFSLSYY